MNSEIENKIDVTINEWWGKRRLKYNIGLVISGLTAFVAYAIVGSILLDIPNEDMGTYHEGFEITIFTTLFQGAGYLFMMGVANLLYFFGPIADEIFNKGNSEKFRIRLFNFGFWFSFALPFSIPILLIILNI